MLSDSTLRAADPLVERLGSSSGSGDGTGVAHQHVLQHQPQAQRMARHLADLGDFI